MSHKISTANFLPGGPPTTRQLILDALELYGPLNMTQLMSHTLRSRTTVRDTLNSLQSRDNRQVRIKAWHAGRNGTGRMSAIFALGREPDEPKDRVVPPPRGATYNHVVKSTRVDTLLIEARRRNTPASPWDALL